MTAMVVNAFDDGIVIPLKMVCYLVLKGLGFVRLFWESVFELALKIVVLCIKKQQRLYVEGCVLKD